MKVRVRASKNVTVEAEGNDHKELFSQLAQLQEVFGEEKCGKCGGENLAFVVREVEGNHFYELHCRNPNCRAKLPFGAHKKGDTLFPKRKDEDGNWRGQSGWVRYNKEKGVEE